MSRRPARAIAALLALAAHAWAHTTSTGLATLAVSGSSLL